MSGGGIAGILMIFLLVIVLFIAASCVKIVPQASAYVVESLGKYKGTWATGLHFKVPFIERVAIRVNLKEQVVDFPPQPVITKDNVTMQIDTVVFFQITDPKLFAYGVVNPLMAIENLTATTLRNIIGDLELDETLTSREIINTKMQAAPSGCRAIKNSPVSGMMRFTGESCFFISVLLSLPGLSALPRFP
jgi:regulator of protease activity HflC (stomatin/prohibitin superfamily)